MESLVFWLFLGTSVITHQPIIEYRVVEYPDGGCLVALSRAKLTGGWNASCMTPKQLEDFKKKR